MYLEKLVVYSGITLMVWREQGLHGILEKERFRKNLFENKYQCSCFLFVWLLFVLKQLVNYWGRGQAYCFDKMMSNFHSLE